jgi:hypothetical protein
VGQAGRGSWSVVTGQGAARAERGGACSVVHVNAICGRMTHT